MDNANAIEKLKGPCVVLAGAGTGKTYTIVEKIKHIAESKAYDLSRVVCITFSNEAANNLTLRIEKALGLNAADKNKPVIRTFHGFGADLLRAHGDKIGISKEFKILDPDQAKVVLHRNLKVNAGNCHKYIGTIGTAKDLGIKLLDFQEFLAVELKLYDGQDLERRLENLSFELQTLHLRKEYGKKKELVKEIDRIRRIIELKKFVNTWNAYEKLKQKGNYQDYSDLNANALVLLEKFPEISRDYQYVIVDEFQDTNKIQLDFLVKLALYGNITVVGDINQSIYRFRGAYKENLSLFKKAFLVTDKDIFTLAKSHRSPNRVLRIAHKLIGHNYQNPEDNFFVENVRGVEGDKIRVYELRNAREEARKVVEIVKKEISNGMPLEEICVMFRAHQHGRIIRKALEDAGIEYYSVSKASLMKQKSVKAVHNYLVIVDKLKKKEKGAESAWWELIYNLDFSHEDLIAIGKKIKEMTKRDRNNGGDKAVSDNTRITGDNDKVSGIMDNNSNVRELLSVYLFNNLESIVSEKSKMAAKILVEKIKLMLQSSNKPISEFLQEVVKISGIIGEQKSKEEREAMINLNKFVEMSKTHEELYDSDLSNFLYYLNVLSDLGIEIEASEIEEHGVRLMTSHSTKGLEYKTVIITNLASGRFPIERYSANGLIPTELLPEIKDEIKGLSEEDKEEFIISFEKYNQLLEERRLAYVSFTRAKEKLILTYANEYGTKKTLPSTFLSEIDFKRNDDVEFIVDFETLASEEKKEKRDLIYFLNAGEIEQSLKEIPQEKKEHTRFSPSALNLFDKCQKEFEYKYVYNMPEKKSVSWEAMQLGSFVHLVLERGVNSGFRSVDEFLQLARELNMEEDWENISLPEAETIVKVFFERHKDKYNENTKTEQYLPLQLSGMDFIGFADRIDFDSSGGAIIVDYKTGKWNIAPKERNWQLGFYALAAKEKYGSVKKVILDMLRQERPLEFEIDSAGNAHCISSKFIDGFNINEIKQELIDTALKIQNAYKKGFKPCLIEKNCEFCNEYVYGL